MYKTLMSTAAVACMLTGPVQAHELWLNSVQSADGSLAAELAYGHEFPAPGVIDDDRLSLLDMPMVHTATSKQLLQRDDTTNYLFHTDIAAADALMLSANYRPTYWTRNADGWTQGSRKEVKQPLECSQASMHAKHILPKPAGTHADIQQPLGLELELMLEQHPNHFRVNQPFTLQVLREGKPLANAQVLGTFAGFPEEQAAFHGHTNDEGKIDVLPLRSGYWMLVVEHETAHAQPELCDQRTYVATLTFNIPESR